MAAFWAQPQGRPGLLCGGSDLGGHSGEIRPGGIQGYDTVSRVCHHFQSHPAFHVYRQRPAFWRHPGATRGVMAPYVQYLEAAYRDWSKTHTTAAGKTGENAIPGYAPGGAVQPPQSGACCPVPWASQRRNHRPNRSAAPGAPTAWPGTPIGLFLSPQETPPFEISLLGAESAALTHGDPWVSPAAYLTDLLGRIVYGKPEASAPY